mmetsp:Transcript_16663/g.25884  ORF Transcript_16663/g.25884 Transcript_16663/m.25884 type:complete len:89 (+) Transcript_16663:747-1013(+)
MRKGRTMLKEEDKVAVALPLRSYSSTFIRESFKDESDLRLRLASSFQSSTSSVLLNQRNSITLLWLLVDSGNPLLVHHPTYRTLVVST